MSVISIYLIFSMLAVIWYDSTRYIIPNWLVGLLLGVYPLAVLMAHSHIDWPMAFAGAMMVLFVGYIIFMKRIMGGGDVKLITACALWVGYQNLLEFLFMFSLLGGVFAVGVLGARKLLPFVPKLTKSGTIPRILRDKEPVPYGVAISIGFLWMMYNGKIPAIL